MSKFLKFIVNLFLICAILVAAAIIVPPLCGVGTTIVDTQLMDTNLPMGSVTYSKDVYITELAEGDRIIDENDVSAYVYTIRKLDTSTGSVAVGDPFDATKEEKEIQILNSEAKVIFTIPYIGYVVYAMHSIEGIIILALAVLLIIILFILSELWRKDDDDEDEDEDDEEEYEEEENEEAPLMIPETEALDLQNEVDIKPYLPEGKEETPESAAPAMQNTREADDILVEIGPGTQPEEETEAAAIPSIIEETPIVQEALPAEKDAGEAVEVPETVIRIPEADLGQVKVPVIPEIKVSSASSEEASSGQTEEAAEEMIREEAPKAEEEKPDQDAIDMAHLEEGLEDILASEIAQETGGKTETAADGQPEEAGEAPAEVKEPEATAPDEAQDGQDVIRAAEAITDDVPENDQYDERRYLEEVQAEEWSAEEDAFVPVARPSMEEIMKGAERSGSEPEVTKDPYTGLTVVDYSDLL